MQSPPLKSPAGACIIFTPETATTADVARTAAVSTTTVQTKTTKYLSAAVPR